MADLRVDEAVRSRARTAWLERQAAEEATFTGVLSDLAEGGRPVEIDTRAGHRHRGPIVVVGSDFCAVRPPTQLVVVRFDAVVAVHPSTHGAAPTGDRVVAPATPFARALAAWQDTGARLRIDVGDAWVVGEIGSVGRDVLTLRTDDGGAVYVPLASLDEVSVLESG